MRVSLARRQYLVYEKVSTVSDCFRLFLIVSYAQLKRRIGNNQKQKKARAVCAFLAAHRKQSETKEGL